MKFEIPQPMKIEHDELHEMLAAATKVGGEIGEAAKYVAKILHPHFVNEEAYALPPLGLLQDLASGKITSEMKEVLEMTEKLKSELPTMLEEHRTIVTALDKLIEVAKKENKMEYANFAEKLKLHAKTEEELFYPTSILIGEYVKLKLSQKV